MQPNPSPPPSTVAFPRSRLGLLAGIGVLVAVVIAGVGGYLLGASQVGHATLRIQLTNHAGSDVTAQVTVNGALQGTLTVPSGGTATLDVSVAYATANGANFEIEATTTAGPRDSSTVFVNTAGIFVVNLQLG